MSDDPTMISNERLYKPMGNPWTGQKADGSSVAWLGPHKYLYMEASCMTRKIKPIAHLYLSHMERHLKILETLRAKPS